MYSFPSLFYLDGKKNVEIKKNDASSQLVNFSKNKHSEQHDYFLSFQAHYKQHVA